MPGFKFFERTKQDRMELHPKVVYGFEDTDAVPYFEAMGWGEVVDEDPDVIVPLGEINIDPEVVFADGPSKGQYVMPDRAKAAIEARNQEA